MVCPFFLVQMRTVVAFRGTLQSFSDAHGEPWVQTALRGSLLRKVICSSW